MGRKLNMKTWTELKLTHACTYSSFFIPTSHYQTPATIPGKCVGNFNVIITSTPFFFSLYIRSSFFQRDTDILTSLVRPDLLCIKKYIRFQYQTDHLLRYAMYRTDQLIMYRSNKDQIECWNWSWKSVCVTHGRSLDYSWTGITLCNVK